MVGDTGSDEKEPPTRADFPVLSPLPTRWGDNDQYGHANNVVYYAWFDTVVNRWLIDAAGVDVRKLDAIGVVAETSCQYISQVGFPDQLEIGLRIDRLGARSITYGLAVFKEGDDKPSATGRFVHVYVDADSRRPVPVPEPVRSAAESITSSAGSL